MNVHNGFRSLRRMDVFQRDVARLGPTLFPAPRSWVPRVDGWSRVLLLAFYAQIVDTIQKQ